MPSDEVTSNEVIIRSGRKLMAGTEQWAVRKDDEPCYFIDFLSEARQFNGTVYLAFASAIVDANNEPIVDIVSRLRMNLGFAQVLHNALGHLIDNALKPTDVSKAN